MIVAGRFLKREEAENTERLIQQMEHSVFRIYVKPCYMGDYVQSDINLNNSMI